MRRYTKLCENYAKLCDPMQHNTKLCETMRNYAKLCETIRNYAKLCRKYAKLCGPGPWTAPFLGPALGPWPLALALDHHDQDDDDYVVTT